MAGASAYIGAPRITARRVGLEDNFCFGQIPIIGQRARALQSDIIVCGICEQIPTIMMHHEAVGDDQPTTNFSECLDNRNTTYGSPALAVMIGFE